MSLKHIDFNEDFIKALDLIENSDKSVFITGKAGTGKSTLLKYFRENSAKKFVVLAPTGVSAINVEGQTIHSFFNFKPDITPLSANKIKPIDKEIYKELEMIVIDEISMVRADLLDSVDVFLRKYGKHRSKPFGGIKMVFIGDLYQLPPVLTNRDSLAYYAHYKSPYFFGARVFNLLDMEFVELTKIYRQSDNTFIEILNKIRNYTVTDEDILKLNSRLNPDFKDDEGYIYLTTTNDLAEEINSTKLKNLNGNLYNFKGEIRGSFSKEDMPTLPVLELKKSAQVMLLNNDSLGRWINGSIGKILDFYPDDEKIVVKLNDGNVVDVTPYKWDIFRFYLDKREDKIKSETIGSFIQYPLKLSYAITIHKSQGKTFDKVIIDLGRGTFSSGQLYVALSRCTSLEGIVLKKPINKGHIKLDKEVIKFLTNYQYMLSEKKFPLQEKIKILEKSLQEKKSIEIVYLKTRDEKTKRKIIPLFIGELEYNGKTFLGLTAHCLLRNEERVFRIDRILEIRELN
ncbi:MAG: AAA family ATPase [Proteobacteria bacterium]|nr:AAA family ATPase [Pseudomonadota bacterium]